jgi:hypothetical protein
MCRKCLKSRGLKECKICKAILPALVSFKEGSAVCDACGPQKKWLKKDQKRKDTYYQSRYGISLEEFEIQKARQNGVCKICQGAEATMVDHDHKTGVIRGLLCMQCNFGIGHLKDSPAILKAAADYLGEKENDKIEPIIEVTKLDATTQRLSVELATTKDRLENISFQLSLAQKEVDRFRKTGADAMWLEAAINSVRQAIEDDKIRDSHLTILADAVKRLQKLQSAISRARNS